MTNREKQIFLYLEDYYRSIASSRSSIDNAITLLTPLILIASLGFTLCYKLEINYLWLIISSWVMLFVSFLTMFCSHHTSITFIEKEAKELNSSLNTGDVYNPKKDGLTGIMNFFSPIFFCSGLFMMIIFSILNVLN